MLEYMYDQRSVELDRTVFLLDILFTIIAYIVSFYANQFFDYKDNIYLIYHLYLLPIAIFLIIIFLSYFQAYASPRHTKISSYMWSVFKGVAVAAGVFLFLLYFLSINYISVNVVVVFFAIEFIFITIVRVFTKYYFSLSISGADNRLKLIIVGTGERAKEVASKIASRSDWGVEVVGYIDPDAELVGQEVQGVPVIGTVNDINDCLKRYVVDEVIIAIPRSLLDDAEPIANACEQEGIKLRFMADIYSLQVARISLAQVGGVPLLTMEPVSQNADMLFVKRLFDLVITIIALPFLLPVMAAVAIAIKLDSPGPVLFVQQRVGLRKHLFPMYKFRSMFVDAEQKIHEIQHLNEADGPIFKIANDPRVTKVGKFIRKTSLDELPQLFNVLQGKMSLVGPRPMSIRDVDLFDKGIQRKRFSVKPGITCIWQISGRSNLPFDKWLELDLNYIENWSLWLDFKILLKTIPAVMKSSGAV